MFGLSCRYCFLKLVFLIQKSIIPFSWCLTTNILIKGTHDYGVWWLGNFLISFTIEYSKLWFIFIMRRIGVTNHSRKQQRQNQSCFFLGQKWLFTSSCGATGFFSAPEANQSFFYFLSIFFWKFKMACSHCGNILLSVIFCFAIITPTRIKYLNVKLIFSNCGFAI